jgi:hypothetical protein
MTSQHLCPNPRCAQPLVVSKLNHGWQRIYCENWKCRSVLMGKGQQYNPRWGVDTKTAFESLKARWLEAHPKKGKK